MKRINGKTDEFVLKMVIAITNRISRLKDLNLDVDNVKNNIVKNSETEYYYDIDITDEELDTLPIGLKKIF